MVPISIWVYDSTHKRRRVTMRVSSFKRDRRSNFKYPIKKVGASKLKLVGVRRSKRRLEGVLTRALPFDRLPYY